MGYPRESLRPKTEGYNGIFAVCIFVSTGRDEKLKHTPLYDLHVAAGAKMGEFAGHAMPLFYPLGLMKEHLHTREKAGLFDICHMLHIEVTGAGAAPAIERACPYNASEQPIGSCKYTFFLNQSAGIIDDLIVTRLDQHRYLIVANAGCAEKDFQHIQKIAKDFDCEVNAIPRGFIALQGPYAEKALGKVGVDGTNLAFMHAHEPRSGWFISRTGYTGEDGFEVAAPVSQIADFVGGLLGDDNVEPIGLGARDSLRLEAGLSLYGQDLDEDITPHEAGLIWSIPKSHREGGSFIGADALARKIAEGRSRRRIGLSTVEKMPVRAGAKLYDQSDLEIGTVTSGGFGPSAGKPVALGLISVDAGQNEIFAEVRGKKIKMEETKLPFIAHTYKR